MVEQHQSAEALLLACRARLDAGLSYAVQLEIVRTLVGGITVVTKGVRLGKTAKVHVQYHFRAAAEAAAEDALAAARGDLHRG